MEREKQQEDEEFINRMVHVVCFAGSDRSRIVAEVLNRRGYIASHGGVIGKHNYTTPEDLEDVGTVLFTTETVKRRFEEDERLVMQMERFKPRTEILCITEAEKERAIQGGPSKMEALRRVVRAKLDLFGFEDLGGAGEN